MQQNWPLYDCLSLREVRTPSPLSLARHHRLLGESRARWYQRGPHTPSLRPTAQGTPLTRPVLVNRLVSLSDTDSHSSLQSWFRKS